MTEQKICRICGTKLSADARMPNCSMRCRFLSKISYGKQDNMNTCIMWKGALHGKGYGHFRIGQRIEKAHRIAYELFVGEIPDGLLVCHRCDTPGCVNPLHLFLGTNDDNLQDRQEKRRHAHHERHARAKLTVDAVRSIRVDPRSASKIAAVFDVSKATIISARSGKTWKGI